MQAVVQHCDLDDSNRGGYQGTVEGTHVFPYGDVPLSRLSFSGFLFQDRVSFFYSQLNDRVVFLMIDSIAWYYMVSFVWIVTFLKDFSKFLGQHTIFFEEIPGQGIGFANFTPGLLQVYSVVTQQ